MAHYPPIYWRGLQIGYEQIRGEPSPDVARLVSLLQATFGQPAFDRWGAPGYTSLDDPATTPGDAWVAQVIDAELARHDKTESDIKCGPCVTSALAEQSPGALWTGDVGTRCKYVGNVWVSSRTYLLLRGGSQWLVPCTRMPFYATLAWPCRINSSLEWQQGA